MTQFIRRLRFLLLPLMLAISCATPSQAATNDALAGAITDTAAFILDAVKEPQVGSIGGEWAVMGLARSGCIVPEEYYQDYHTTAEQYVIACKGILHRKKHTEYARVTLALTAIGKDPRHVGGYNLLTPLGDYDKTIWQGLNGPIWALIALDTGNYPMPQNSTAKTQATRAMYVQRILDCQLSDGGWSLLGGTAAATPGDGVSDPDITGMALQALARYQQQPAVKEAIDEALACMSARQNDRGGFSSWGTENAESVVQIIVALTELSVSLDDPRFVKNRHTLLDNLLTFHLPGKGFRHTTDGSGSNQMATEQAFYGMIAAQRARDGKPGLYQMRDALVLGDGSRSEPARGAGLAGKVPAVKAAPVTKPDIRFTDILLSDQAAAIEQLAAREILTGRGNDRFDPDAGMTRAEFAAIVVRALGLTPVTSGAFSDVAADKWYAPYIGTATSYGIIQGVANGRFNPEGSVSRQEAAVMLARAASCCGMDTTLETAAVRDILAPFADYVTTVEWSRAGLAFCYSTGILDDAALDIQGSRSIKRYEIAQMVYNLLSAANLLSPVAR